MDLTELIELMKKRWTARKFGSRKVSDKDLETILEAGRWAPSGGNKQPWELVVIRDEEIKEKIAQLYSNAMGLDKPSERYTSPSILIAVCIDTRTMDSYPDMMPAEFITYAGIGAMVQNMSLAATLMDIVISWGTQPIGIHDELKKLLSLPDYMYIPDILQVGYPAQERYLTSRREVDEFAHHDEMDETILREF